MGLLLFDDSFWEKAQIGDWTFTEDEGYLIIRLQAGEGGLAVIRIKPDQNVPGDQAIWQWDGNRESPTLEPSILHHNEPEWHGYLRAGRLEQA